MALQHLAHSQGGLRVVGLFVLIIIHGFFMRDFIRKLKYWKWWWFCHKVLFKIRPDLRFNAKWSHKNYLGQIIHFLFI